MASTVSGTLLTNSHRLLQLRIRSLTLSQTLQLFKTLSWRELDASAQSWALAVLRTTQAGQMMSAKAAAQYAAAFAKAERGVPLSGPVSPVIKTDGTTLLKRFNYVPTRIKTGYARNEMYQQTYDKALSINLGQVSDAVLSAGRDTVMSVIDGTNPTVPSSEKALGVARIAGENACAWCSMMASRGAVYHSDETAMAGTHENCACEPEGVYDDQWEMPASSQYHLEQYQKARDDSGGTSVLNAMRRAQNA